VCRHHNDKPDRPEDLRAVSRSDVTERVIMLMIIYASPLTSSPRNTAIRKNGSMNNDVHDQVGNVKILRKSVSP